MDRAVSVSAQRIGSMFRHRPAVSLPDRLKAAFTSQGLTVSTVAITKAEASEGYILTASGFHADGTPYAFASAPFTGDPVARAEQAAADIVKAHTGAANTNGADVSVRADVKITGETTVTDTASTVGLAAVAAATAAPAKPGDLTSALKAFRARKESLAAKVIDTKEKVEEALTKGTALLDSEAKEAQAFLDEINQLTNGGPA